MIIIGTPLFDGQRAVLLAGHLVDEISDDKDGRRQREFLKEGRRQRVKVSRTVIKSENDGIRRQRRIFPLGSQEGLQ